MRSRPVAEAVGRALLVGLAVASSGCALGAARVGQFEKFAAAGSQFGQAVPTALDDSFAATVQTSSLVLEQARAGLNQADRLDAIEQSNQDLEKRLAILNDLKRHLGLLESYFTALSALAGTDASSSGLSGVADGLVASLGKLSPKIAQATLGGVTISSLVAPAVEFGFTTYQSGVLNHELKRNAGAIDKELRLQQAALAALAAAMTSDLEAQFAQQDRDSIVLPYVRSGTLPADWEQQRLTSLKRRLELTSIDAASAAAASLRARFVELVENRLGDAQITALLQDVNAILSIVEQASGGKGGGPS